MTFECSMRFLTDYLQGDTYFKIHRENHNLDRCRTQFKLVSDMEAKWDTMNKIIKNIIEVEIRSWSEMNCSLSYSIAFSPTLS